MILPASGVEIETGRQQAGNLTPPTAHRLRCGEGCGGLAAAMTYTYMYHARNICETPRVSPSCEQTRSLQLSHSKRHTLCFRRSESGQTRALFRTETPWPRRSHRRAQEWPRLPQRGGGVCSSCIAQPSPTRAHDTHTHAPNPSVQRPYYISCARLPRLNSGESLGAVPVATRARALPGSRCVFLTSSWWQACVHHLQFPKVMKHHETRMDLRY